MILILIILLLNLIVTEQSVQCNHVWHMNNDQRLDSNILRTVVETSVTYCMYLCEMLDGCKAIEHEAATKTCVLRAGRHSPSVKMVTSNGWDLYQAHCKGLQLKFGF